MKLTLAEVERRVKEVEKYAPDDELAHALEDNLRRDVLQAIADGARDARKLAAAALKTSEIEFSRWYA